MNKEMYFTDLPILTPFRTRKGGDTYIKMPLFDNNGLPCNMYCLEDKKYLLKINNPKVYPVDLIIEEI